MSSLNLLKHRRFFPLFWTQFFGALNDNFLKNALVILIAFKASNVMGLPSSEMVSLAGGIFILPFFLFSATAGQLADKYEKGKLIRIIKLVEIGIMALATYGLVQTQFEFLLIVLFLMGLHSTFFGPLKFSILPQHLKQKELIGGNALIEAGTFLAILIGTIGGGVLVSIPEQGPGLVGLVLLAVALIGFATSWMIPEAKAVDPGLNVQWNPVTPTWQILKFTKKNRTVFLSTLGISWFWFFGAATLSLFPIYCKNVLHSDESVVTLFLACFSVGIGLGSILCERLSQHRIELGLVPLGSLGLSIFTIDLSFAGRPEAFGSSLKTQATAYDFIQNSQGVHVLFDLILLSVFSGLFIVPLVSLIQERSEVTHRSRVIAGNNIINAFFMVVSSGMLVALMKMNVSVPHIFLLLAFLNAAVAVYIYSLLPEFLLRFFAWVVAHCMYRIKIEGLGNIPNKGAAVLVCNHVSFVDWLIIAAAVPRPVRFVMHHSFAKGLFGKGLMRNAKVIPIASFKENPKVLESAFAQIAVELQNSELIGLFPEGEITRDGLLSPFKSGIEKIIQRTPVDVIPMALIGMWGSFFSRKKGSAMSGLPKRFWFRVHLVIGSPITAKDVTVERVHEKIAGLLKLK